MRKETIHGSMQLGRTLLSSLAGDAIYLCSRKLGLGDSETNFYHNNIQLAFYKDIHSKAAVAENQCQYTDSRLQCHVLLPGAHDNNEEEEGKGANRSDARRVSNFCVGQWTRS